MMVCDADAGVQEVVEKHNIMLARCANHGGKNIGNQGIEIGKNHSLCNCKGVKSTLCFPATNAVMRTPPKCYGGRTGDITSCIGRTGQGRPGFPDVKSG